jgi:hypothetical protein
MEAMTSLNLSSNTLGKLVLPAGWTDNGNGWEGASLPAGCPIYQHSDGREQKEHPGEPEGIIAVANAIKNMGVLTSLNLASTYLKAEGGKIMAEAIKVISCAIVVVSVYRFHAHLTTG